MTDIKKTAQKKGPPEARKLALNKETIKDLTPGEAKANDVRGGQCCSRVQSGCMS